MTHPTDEAEQRYVGGLLNADATHDERRIERVLASLDGAPEPAATNRRSWSWLTVAAGLATVGLVAWLAAGRDFATAPGQPQRFEFHTEFENLELDGTLDVHPDHGAVLRFTLQELELVLGCDSNGVWVMPAGTAPTRLPSSERFPVWLDISPTGLLGNPFRWIEQHAQAGDREQQGQDVWLRWPDHGTPPGIWTAVLAGTRVLSLERELDSDRDEPDHEHDSDHDHDHDHDDHSHDDDEHEHDDDQDDDRDDDDHDDDSDHGHDHDHHRDEQDRDPNEAPPVTQILKSLHAVLGDLGWPHELELRAMPTPELQASWFSPEAHRN